MSILSKLYTLSSRLERASRISNVRKDEKHRVRHKGIFKSTVAATTAVDLDWKIDQLTYNNPGYPPVNVPSMMTGVRYKVVGGEAINPPEIDFCVLDKDNILGLGAGYVLDGFADGFYMFSEDGDEIREHQGDLIAGLYIRAHVNNVGNVPCTFICNLLRYIDTSGV